MSTRPRLGHGVDCDEWPLGFGMRRLSVPARPPSGCGGQCGCGLLCSAREVTVSIADSSLPLARQTAVGRSDAARVGCCGRPWSRCCPPDVR